MAKDHKDSVKNPGAIVNVAEQLRQLSRIYLTSQRFRNRYGNMLGGKAGYLKACGTDMDEITPVFAKPVNDLSSFEDGLKKKIVKLLKLHPWGNELTSIKAVGPVIAASVIGELGGFRYGSIPEGEIGWKPSNKLGEGRTFESTADLWSFAGWGVRDGKAIRPTHGEKSSYNRYLKLATYYLADGCVKVGGPYRDVYDMRKKYEQVNHPELKPFHIEKRVKRYVAKKFLSDINHKFLMKGGE